MLNKYWHKFQFHREHANVQMQNIHLSTHTQVTYCVVCKIFQHISTEHYKYDQCALTILANHQCLCPNNDNCLLFYSNAV